MAALGQVAGVKYASYRSPVSADASSPAPIASSRKLASEARETLMAERDWRTASSATPGDRRREPAAAHRRRAGRAPRRHLSRRAARSGRSEADADARRRRPRSPSRRSATVPSSRTRGAGVAADQRSPRGTRLDRARRRRALRLAAVAPRALVRRHRHPHARPRRRRRHGHLQHRRHRAAAAAAVSPSPRSWSRSGRATRRRRCRKERLSPVNFMDYRGVQRGVRRRRRVVAARDQSRRAGHASPSASARSRPARNLFRAARRVDRARAGISGRTGRSTRATASP